MVEKIDGHLKANFTSFMNGTDGGLPTGLLAGVFSDLKNASPYDIATALAARTQRSCLRSAWRL